MNFDPFVLWDHFYVSPGNGFPDHPHRGFEAITYLFSGAMQHTDNLGNQSTVGPGGAQRFTAGSGIVHSEMPGAEGVSEGIQLWINLPKRLKSIDAEYQQLNADDIPEYTQGGGRIRVIVGEGSALHLHTPVRYLDIQLQDGAEYQEAVADSHRAIIYVRQGAIEYEDQSVSAGESLLIENAEKIKIKARETSQLMLCVGIPHGEPIKQHGPFVD
jgi:redox-sensitive bicupin YhaK (pirin superfamily)